MKASYFMLLFACSLAGRSVSAQEPAVDSLNVANTLKELFTICRTVDFSDPKVIELGLFYKAAPYIMYHGTDSSRAWKSCANYKNVDERKEVDDICLRINGTVNRDRDFRITRYFTQKEEEGTWYLLLVAYDKKGVTKTAVFAFLKIGDRFALGDID